MSRKGKPYNHVLHVLMESFYRTIKRALINDAQFRDIDQAQTEIFKYIKFTLIPNECILNLAINLIKTSKEVILILLTKYLVFLENSRNLYLLV